LCGIIINRQTPERFEIGNPNGICLYRSGSIFLTQDKKDKTQDPFIHNTYQFSILLHPELSEINKPNSRKIFYVSVLPAIIQEQMPGCPDFDSSETPDWSQSVKTNFACYKMVG